MHTKRVFEITGGYPENHGFDTQHFAVRFLSNNLKALVCHSAFDYHRIHSNQNNYYHREYLSGKSNYNWIKIFSENIHFFNEEMAQMDMRDEIADIICPTLVIGGTIDPVTPPACSEAIAFAIGDNAILHMFEGCGHGPHRDNPDGAENVMRNFLKN